MFPSLNMVRSLMPAPDTGCLPVRYIDRIKDFQGGVNNQIDSLSLSLAQQESTGMNSDPWSKLVLVCVVYCVWEDPTVGSGW